MSSSTDPAAGRKPCCFTEFLEILRELPVFNGVPLDVIKVLAYLSGVESFVPGEALCQQGEPLETCMYVVSGDVEVLRQSEVCEAGLSRRGSGYVFGGLGLLAPVKALYTVRAVSDVDCLVLTREKFLKTSERFPHIMPRILGNVVSHVFRWEEAFLKAHAEECACRGGEMGLSLF